MNNTMQPAQNLEELFNDLGKFDFTAGNQILLSTILKLNLLWSAIFLVGFYLLWDVITHYVPFIKRIPVIPTFFGFVWFTACLLICMVIYMATTSRIIKALGALFLLLLLISFILAAYKLGGSIALLYHHKSFKIAMMGPIVVKINDSYFSVNDVPLCVCVKHDSGSLYFNGSKLAASDVENLNIDVYSGKFQTKYERNRNDRKAAAIIVNGKKYGLTTFTPHTSESTITAKTV